MKKSVASILFKKSLLSLKENFKQFLSIIFIIAIAVTLFVGLQANYKSISSRVDDMYKKGNMADLFATYSLFTEKDNDIEEIRNYLNYDVNVDTRLNISAKVEGRSTNILLSDGYPYISKPSAILKKLDDKTYAETPLPFEHRKDYFIIDKSVVETLAVTGSGESGINIGDELSISISTIEYKDMVIELVKETLNNLKEQDTTGLIFTDELINSILEGVENYFNNNPTINLNSKVTNFMEHPENISSKNDTTPVAIMAKDIFMGQLTDELYSSLQDTIPTYGKEFLKTIIDDLPPFYNQLLIKFNDSSDILAGTNILREFYQHKATQETDSILGKMLYMTDLSTLPSNAAIQNDIDQAAALSFVFPLIFMVVAVLIVITTISQLILKERTQIGTFKGLGLSDNEILFHYELIGGFLSLIGLLIGAIAGPLILPMILDIKYQMLYSVSKAGFVFPFISFLFMFIGVVGIVSLITYLIIIKELKTTTAQSMRPLAPKIKFFTKEVKKDKKVFSFMSLKIALRNIKVYFTKSIMVIIGVIGCTALLVCGFGIEDSVNFGIEADLNRYYSSDIMLNYSSPSSKVLNEIKNDVEFKDIIDPELTFDVVTLPTTINYKESPKYLTTAMICESDVYDKKILDVKVEFNKDECIVPKKRASDLGINIGDMLEFEIYGNVYFKKVAHIFDHFSMSCIFLHSEDESYNELLSYKTSAYLNFDETKVDVNDIKLMNSYASKLSSKTGISSAIGSLNMKDKIQGYVSGVYEMTNTIKAFAIALAVVCLINLALLNFKERMREMATLKVLGFSTFEIARSLIYEVMILTFIGVGIGLLLGLPMEMLVLSINENNLVSFIYVIYPISYIISIILSIGTAFLINSLLSLSIKKIPMVESLKSVE